MATVLDQTTALKELAELWEEDAAAHRRYDVDDPKAKLLERCADDVRRVLGENTPEWVPIRTVHATTGRSLPALRRRCEDLERQGRARKMRGGRWEIALEAALEIPVIRERTAIGPGMDMGALARMYGRRE